MNLTTELPSTVAEWVHLLITAYVDALLMIVTNGYWLTATITFLLLCTIAFCAEHGTPEDSPILTEAEREQAS